METKTESKFKVQDQVRLNLRYSPEMIISEINEETQEAKCYWYDYKDTKRIISQWVPLNTLEHLPEQINLDDLRKAIRR